MRPPDQRPVASERREIVRLPGESQKLYQATARWICAIYSDFSVSVGIRRKRRLLGAGGSNMLPRNQRPVALGRREIARPPGDSQKLYQGPERRVSAIYLDFAGYVGTLRKRGLRARWVKYATP